MGGHRPAHLTTYLAGFATKPTTILGHGQLHLVNRLYTNMSVIICLIIIQLDGLSNVQCYEIQQEMLAPLLVYP